MGAAACGVAAAMGTLMNSTHRQSRYDDHVARLLDEAVYHSEHLRLGDAAIGQQQPSLMAQAGT